MKKLCLTIELKLLLKTLIRNIRALVFYIKINTKVNFQKLQTQFVTFKNLL